MILEHLTTLFENQIAIPALIFCIILLIFFAVKSVMDLREKDQTIDKRVSKWGAYTEKIYDKSDQLRRRNNTGLFRWFVKIFPFAGKKTVTSDIGIYSDTPLDFQRAGMYNPVHIQIYRLSRILLGILPFVAYFLYLLFYNQPITLKNGGIAFYVAVVFFLLPMFWMKRRVNKRKESFEKAFPNAMDLLVVCVEAGMGFDTAIARVASEMDLSCPSLAQEFKILSLEMKTGKSRNDCMNNLAKRVNLSDVDNLVNLLVQAEKFGTGIAHPLRIHAEEMREKRYNKMEELAAKLPVKLSFPLVLFIFPAMLIALIGPSIIMMYRLFRID